MIDGAKNTSSTHLAHSLFSPWLRTRAFLFYFALATKGNKHNGALGWRPSEEVTFYVAPSLHAPHN